MRPVKRLEIITGRQEFDRVVKILEHFGVTGFTYHEVEGRGDRRSDSVDALTGGSQTMLITTTCPPEEVDGLVEALRPLLSLFGGACVVYDASLMIHTPRAVVASGG